LASESSSASVFKGDIVTPSQLDNPCITIRLSQGGNLARFGTGKIPRRSREARTGNATRPLLLLYHESDLQDIRDRRDGKTPAPVPGFLRTIIMSCAVVLTIVYTSKLCG
jgi:hypothetical protein